MAHHHQQRLPFATRRAEAESIGYILRLLHLRESVAAGADGGGWEDAGGGEEAGGDGRAEGRGGAGGHPDGAGGRHPHPQAQAHHAPRIPHR